MWVAEKKAGPNGGSDGARGEWGGHLKLRHTLDPDILSLDDLDYSSDEEGEDGVCDPRLDMRDDQIDSRPLPPPPTSAPATPPNGWGLLLKCEMHVAVGGSLLPPATLGTSILDVLRRYSRHDVELQTRLFELLGEQVPQPQEWLDRAEEMSPMFIAWMQAYRMKRCDASFGAVSPLRRALILRVCVVL